MMHSPENKVREILAHAGLPPESHCWSGRSRIVSVRFPLHPWFLPNSLFLGCVCVKSRKSKCQDFLLVWTLSKKFNHVQFWVLLVLHYYFDYFSSSPVFPRSIFIDFYFTKYIWLTDLQLVCQTYQLLPCSVYHFPFDIALLFL